MTGRPDAPKRVFLDASVLYAAARGGKVAKLWSLEHVTLVTSEYAANEAWVNLQENEREAKYLNRLGELLERMEVRPHVAGEFLFRGWTLPDPHDIPILAGAIQAGCQYLVTGDKKCFGKFFGETLDGVTILLPRDFLAMVQSREAPEGG